MGPLEHQAVTGPYPVPQQHLLIYATVQKVVGLHVPIGRQGYFQLSGRLYLQQKRWE